MIPQRPAARPVALVALAVVGVLLSGCSSLGIHPGSAAVVGSEQVSMSKIDTTATLFCKAYVAQSRSSDQQQSGPLPMSAFRSYAASSLAKRLLGQQLAAQYGVEPASGYQQQVSQYEQALASAPADQRDAVIAVAGGDAYLQNVQVAIGQKLTATYGQSNAQIKAALQRGQVATKDWLDHHQVSLDPVFGLSVAGGSFTGKLDQTSYPVSPLASAGATANGQQAPSSTYTSQLPPAQICGTNE